MKLTNNSRGPKAITTTDQGVVVLQPGASRDLNVGDDDMAAIKRVKLLEADSSPGAPSLADVQREIASTSPGGGAETEAPVDAEANLPAADDPEVVAMVADNTSDELQQLAKDSKADMAGAKNKTDAARRIIAAQRAAGAAGGAAGGTGGQTGAETLPAADDADVVALIDANDEAALRQLADDEKVTVTSDDDKADLSRKIVAARRATA